jgi:TRAP-type C4-dicarboxylate transport system permease small subunit
MASPTITISAKDLNLPDGARTVQDGDIQTLLMSVYMVAGFVAIIIIVIGGIRYVTSNGDATAVKSAKDTILYAVVGLVVVIMAAAITTFVIENVAR